MFVPEDPVEGRETEGRARKLRSYKSRKVSREVREGGDCSMTGPGEVRVKPELVLPSACSSYES